MFDLLLDLVARYGYAVVALFVFAEGVGVPLPSETALLIAAAVAAQGRLSLAGVIVAASVGGILGGTGGYWIGRSGGPVRMALRVRWLGVTPDGLERAHRFFTRYGPLAIFLARFVAFLRTLVSVAAGTAGMPFGRFAIYNTLGTVLWAAVVAGAGFLLSETIGLRHGLGRAGLALALLIALVVGLLLGWRWFSTNREVLVGRVWRRWRRAATVALPRFRKRYPRLWSGVTARFERGGYLGLHLIVGFACSLVGLWAFASVTGDVLGEDSLTRFDTVLAQWFRAHATPAGDQIFDAVTQLGSAPVITALVVAVAAVLALRRRWMVLAGWAAAVAGGLGLNQALKLLIQRPRPPVAALPLDSFSFPSGHAMASLIAYGMLAYLLWPGPRHRGARAGVVAVTAALVVAIGFSRLYLALHYFSDVVGGYAAGAVWLSACVSGLEIVRRKKAGDSG